METELAPTERRRTTPLPKVQFGLTLLIFHAEPVTATVIYPFIPAFIRRTGITNGDEKKTGYYAGIVESLFFISEFLSVFHWGRLSDRIGRRPVLLIGPLGLTIAMLGFGLSKSFWQLVLFRCAQGVFNGNLGAVKTLVAEITDDTNLADAFTLMSLMWSLGITLGPAIGGLLSDPATRWPAVFGGPLFREYPYFLPCAAAGMFSFIPFVLSYFLLEESRKDYSSVPPASSEPSEQDPLIQRSEPSTQKEEYTLAKILGPNVPLQRSLISHGFQSFTNMSYEVLIPLIYSTSIPLGGLGMNPYQIGSILAVYGVSNAFLQLILWKPMLKRIGPKKMFIISYAGQGGRVLMMLLARVAASRSGRVDSLVWTMIVAQMSFSSLGATAYNSVGTLIVKSSPPRVLGTVNGVQQMISSGFRGLAPTVASSVFAASLALDSQVSGGYYRYIVDVIQMVIIAVGVWFSFKLPSYRLI